MASIKSAANGDAPLISTQPTEILLISGYIRLFVSILAPSLDPLYIFKIIQTYYRKPLLIELMVQELTTEYSRSIAKYLQTYCQETQMKCRDIYKDITNKGLKSVIVNKLSCQFAEISQFKLHDKLRHICFGKKRKSQFGYGITEYLYHIQQSIITYTKSDGDLGHKIDFVQISSVTEQIKLEILVFIYQFAYHWMYGHNNNNNNKRSKRNKLEVCLNGNIQHIFGDIDVMFIPSNLAELLVEDSRVNQSCYFVRNVLNQYLKHTFVPLCVERDNNCL